MKPRYYHIKTWLRRLLGPGAQQARGGWRRTALERISQLHFPDLTGYYSQAGQDAYLDRYVFQRKRGGVFVDIGANDGVNLSNSFFFEEARAWTGLCVEPNPALARQLRERRRCAVAEVAASVREGEVSFAFYTDERHVYGKVATAAESGGKVISVRAQEVNALLAGYGLTKIDYLSIDTEGGELELFQAINLRQFMISAVSLEQNTEAPRMDAALTEAGYRYRAKVGCDRIYQRRE